jgi:amino acid adenylation domain-containing protein
LRADMKTAADRLEDAYPLSPLQHGMLTNGLRNPGTGVDVEQYIFELRETLDLPNLKHACQCVADRHAILRTSFRWKDLEEPHQEVHTRIELPWKLQDFYRIEIAERDKHFADLLRADRRRSFDLACAPLWRLTVVRYSEAQWRLIWTYHHSILDGIALPLLLRETFAFYDGLVCGDKIALPLPRPFREYIDWLQKQDFGKAEKFWHHTLKGFRTPTPLLIHHTKNIESDIAAPQGTYELRLSSELTTRLRTLTKENHITLNTLMQGAWAVLLSRFSGESDVVFGVLRTARRAIQGAETMVGLLLNTLPLRVLVKSDAPLLAYLKQIRSQGIAMRKYEHTPLANVQAWSEVRPSNPLFQTTVRFDNRSWHSLSQALGSSWSDRRVRYLFQTVQTNHLFDFAAYDGPVLSLRLDFDCKRIDEATAQRILNHLKTFLADAATNPHRPVGQIMLLDCDERDTIRTFESCERLYSRDSTIPDLFEDVVRRCVDTTALVAGAIELSYSALDRRANAVAVALRDAGVARGDRVPLVLGRGVRFVASAIGVLKCGAAFVPLDPAHPSERLARMLDGLGARVGLCASGIDLSATAVRWLDASYADKESSTAAPPRTIGATDTAYVMFTSGSTGRSKGVEVPHRAIVRLVQAQDFARIGPQESWLHMAPTSFDASTLEIWAALLNGGRCVVLEEPLPTPGLLADTICRHGVTSAWFTATLFNTLVDEAPESFAGLQQILVGGEALSPEHIRRAFKQLPGVRFVNGYGPTENTTFTCCHVISQQDVETGSAIPIGRPIANTRVYVLDRDGQPAPVGVPGEMYVGGDGMALGYVGQPAQTAERFIPDTLSGREGERLYRTGDRVRWRPDGVLEYLGRLDDQVKIRGHRIEPGEIEACLCEYPDVRQAAVIAHRASFGVQLVAYVVPQSISAASELTQRLNSHALQQLPDYMVPSVIMVLDRLPLTPNGKLDRQALPAPEQETSNSISFIAPRSSTEAALAEIWSELLDSEKLGVSDDFFDLGGTSLLILRLISKINRSFNVNVTVPDFYRNPTVEQMAKLIVAQPALGGRQPEVIQLQDGRSERRIYFIFAEAPEWNLARMMGDMQVFGIEVPWPLAWRKALAAGRVSEFPSMQQLVAPYVAALAEHAGSLPCVLAGFSFRALMAFEAAHQFQQLGGQVDTVVLVDRWGQYPNRFQILWRKLRLELRLASTPTENETRLKNYAHLTRRAFNRAARPIWQVLGGMPSKARLLMTPVPDERRLFIPWEMQEPFYLEIAKAYRPRCLIGRGILIRADPHDGPDTVRACDESLGWKNLFAAGLEIIRVVGDHSSFAHKYDSVLAQKLTAALK